MICVILLKKTPKLFLFYIHLRVFSMNYPHVQIKSVFVSALILSMVNYSYTLGLLCLCFVLFLFVFLYFQIKLFSSLKSAKLLSSNICDVTQAKLFYSAQVPNRSKKHVSKLFLTKVFSNITVYPTVSSFLLSQKGSNHWHKRVS